MGNIPVFRQVLTVTDASLPDWKDIPLHNALKKAFLSAGFTKPTEIQARSLPRSLAGKDVIGVAETVRSTSSAARQNGMLM